MTPLDVAISQIGVKESPPNSNNVKYNTWYYGRQVSGEKYKWCMVFDQWCYAMAGYTLPFKSASCGDTLDWYKAYRPNCVKVQPKPNDIVIYNFGHTGILEREEGNYIIAIEGNTSSGNSGSQSNGGGVFRRTRKKSLVTAYIRPYDFDKKEDYMTKAEILKELGDQYIKTYDDLPSWAKKPIRKLLDEGIINGGTDASVDPDDINMFLSDIKTIIVIERMLEKLK